MNKIAGIEAVEYLKSRLFDGRVALYKKDNTDKLWSYKMNTPEKSEFAFNPNTKTTLNVWFDRSPPNIDGVTKIQNISSKSGSTALNRVFSGGHHSALYKATIHTKDALNEVIQHFELVDSINKTWTTEELEASVRTYMDMRRKELDQIPFKKKDYYLALSKKYGRTEKSYEYRMQNISYVFSTLGRKWVAGLTPASHVGSNVAKEIENIINRIEGNSLSNIAEFSAKVENIRKRKSTRKPKGKKHPNKIRSNSTHYERDQEVVAWVLNQAKGVCESCGGKAPFEKADGFPYLEVHHLRMLSDGGSDTCENAVAICPNCHRELHFGKRSFSLQKKIYSKVSRLIEE